MNIGSCKKFTNPQSNKSRIIVLSIISILPAIFLIFLVTKYWVNVPFCDQWRISTVFNKYFSQALTFSDLIAQHNESRKLFPRLIILGIGLLTDWNVRVEMCITMIFACLIALNLFALLKRIEGLNIFSKLTLLLIINLLLFSPVQWENWLCGINMIMYIPALMLTTGIVVNTSNISIRRKVTYNSILSIISTFSFANGMLLWLLLLPVNMLLRREDRKCKEKIKKELIHILLYVIIAVSTIGFYFADYHKPSYHPPFFLAFSKPLDAIAFFLVWIATPFIPSNSPYASILPFFVGGLVFSIFILSITYCVYRAYRDSSKLSFFYPWVILGFYSIISGIITTFGRLGFGVRFAAQNRYTTVSIFLPISVVVLVYLIYTFYMRDKKIIKKSFLVIQALALLFFLILYDHTYRFCADAMKWHNIPLADGRLAFLSIVVLACLIYTFYVRRKKIDVEKFLFIQTALLLFFLILYGHSYRCSIDAMKGHNICLENQKIALQFCKIIPHNRKLEAFYSNSQAVVDRFCDLTKVGLLDFRPVKPDILKYLTKVSKNGNVANGYFDECLLLADSKLEVYGWACRPARKTPTNNVMLVYTDKNGDSEPFATLRVGDKRPDVAKVFKSSSMLNCGFSDIIDISNLPDGNLQISAWTVDTKENVAYQLANTYPIRR